MTDPLVLLISFRAAAGQADPLLRRLQQMSTDSMAEVGCRQYDVHADRDEAGRFWLYEIWDDQAAHGRHDQTAHVAGFVADFPTLLAGAPERWNLRLAHPS